MVLTDTDLKALSLLGSFHNAMQATKGEKQS